MGYYAHIKKSTVVIPAVHLDHVLRIFKFINRPEFNTLKSGGSWCDGKQNKFWYSWMQEDYHETCNSVSDVLKELGFYIDDSDTDLGIRITGYDSKLGQEDLFLGVIGHLITGSIEWHGEDGDEWTVEFPSYNNKHHEKVRKIAEQTNLSTKLFYEIFD